jgi:hypothetical protein
LQGRCSCCCLPLPRGRLIFNNSGKEGSSCGRRPCVMGC